MEQHIAPPHKLAVIGVGRIGAVTAVGMAHLLHEVTGIDRNPARVAALSAGKLPEAEPGLRAALTSALRLRSLRFATDLPAEPIDCVFLCVDSPQQADGAADLSQVFAAARDAAQILKPGGLLITRSTIPPGATERLRAALRAIGRSDLGVVHVPEFLREGHAWEDFREPDRIVIGADSAEAAARTEALFQGISAPVFVTSRLTSELAKYAANAYLATSISFANEMSDLAVAVGADAQALFDIMKQDARIGSKAYLSPGLGFGGHCLPKDAAALEYVAAIHGQPMRQLEASIAVNAIRIPRAVSWLRQVLGGLDGRRIALAGLAFKPGTDDLRESPALRLARLLRAEGSTVTGFDALVAPAVEYMTCAGSIESAATGADAVVQVHPYAVTDDSAVALRECMRTQVVFDAPGTLAAAHWREFGFVLNRGCSAPAPTRRAPVL